LDTNTLIYFFKGLGNVSDHLLSTPPNEIGIPTIVLFELEVEIGKSSYPGKRKAKLQEFIPLITIIPFGYDEANCPGDLEIADYRPHQFLGDERETNRDLGGVKK